MDYINLQNKTVAELGTIEIFEFENKHIGLKKTLFHRIIIPLRPFNSGLDYESQPVNTEIVIDWLNLNLKNPSELDKLILKSNPDNDTEVSIYVGSAHNPCDITKMIFNKISNHKYKVDGELLIGFEYEGVAQNEIFRFSTQLKLDIPTKIMS